MSSKTLTEYFTTIIAGSQQFINELPDDFLHDSSKRAYQLINEIQVYLRSGELTKNEYDSITKKTEELIEEVEKLEIAYEVRNNGADTEQFGKTFKSEFDQVLEKPTLLEIWNTYMGRQEAGTQKFSLFFARIETPLILGLILSSGVFWMYGVAGQSVFVAMLTAMLLFGVSFIKLSVRLGRIPFVIVVCVLSVGLKILFI